MLFTPYALVLLLSVVVLLGLAGYVWRTARAVDGAIPFVVGTAIVAAWAGGYALEVSSQELAQKVLIQEVRYPFLAALPVAWFAMAAQYSGRTHWIAGRRLGYLLVVPAISAIMAVTGSLHELWWYNPRLQSAGSLPTLHFDYGPWYWVHTVYNASLMIASVVLLLRLSRRDKPLYLRRNVVVALAMLLPTMLSVLFQAKLVSVSGYNPAPLVFLPTGLAFTWAVLGHRMFDVVPVARGLVVDQMADLVLVLDSRDRVVDFNRSAARGLEFNPATAVGRPLEEVVGKWSEFVHGCRNVEHTRQRVSIGEAEAQHVYNMTVSPIRDPRGRILGRLVVLHDVTDLERAKEAAMAATRAKSLLLANMSHEIRTPLSHVLGFGELLGREPGLTVTQREYLGHMLTGGDHLMALLSDILDMSRIEAGRMEVHRTPFDLRRVIEDVHILFRGPARDKGLELCMEVGEDVARHVLGDEGRIRQVLANLVGNGIKFTSVGGVVVRVRSIAADGARVQFVVEDTGPGIAEAELGELFSPFNQTEIGRRSQRGVGLGLSISRQLVRLMRGEIAVQSEVGHGSRFEFTLPLRVASPEAAHGHAARTTPCRSVTLEPGQPRRRILVVDDNPANRKLLVSMLRDLDAPGADGPTMELMEASSGAEAVEYWESWRPDLIFMDLRMPGMGGREVAREIRVRASAGSGARGTAIVALSGSAFGQDREAALADGCDNFLSRPFRIADVTELLARHLALRFLDAPGPDRADPAQLPSTDDLPHRLAACPPDWIRTLSEAVKLGYLDRVPALAAEVSPRDPGLASHLTHLSTACDQRALLSLLGTGGV